MSNNNRKDLELANFPPPGVTPSQLCAICQSLFDNVDRGRDENIDFHSPTALLQSATSCMSCYLLAQSPIFEMEVANLGEEELSKYDGRVIAHYRKSFFEINLIYNVSNDSNQRNYILPWFTAVEASGSGGHKTASSLFHPTNSEATWHVARKWLSQCIRDGDPDSKFNCQRPHTSCHKPILTLRLPKRLSMLVLRLRKSVSSKSLMTTRDNEQAMIQRINYEALDKTFQDAIVICSKLGIDYLWIDCLCILQGDQEDWENEAMNMGSIYAGSFLNIVAADSPDGMGGCFFDSSVKVHFGFTIYGVLAATGEQRLFNCASSTLKIHQFITSKRAWCFQETMLAPRSLYFHRSQLHWQCRSYEANESFPHGYNFSRPPLRAMVAAGIEAFGEFSDTWAFIVSNYSSCKMILWSDRLIALSGIAQHFHDKYISKFKRESLIDYSSSSDQQYLAGLWRVDLETGLLWRAHKPRDKPAQQQRPTWSWASHPDVVSPFTAGAKVETIAITIIDAATTLTTTTLFGGVNDGNIKLRCNNPIPVTLQTHIYLPNTLNLIVGSFSFRSLVSLDYALTGEMDIFAIFVCSYSGEHFRSYSGLLFQRAYDIGFERLGVFEIYTSLSSHSQLPDSPYLLPGSPRKDPKDWVPAFPGELPPFLGLYQQLEHQIVINLI